VPVVATACVACSSLSTSVVINAPPERVWAVAADLAQYPCWNPFFTSARGKLASGEALDVTMQPVGASAKSFAPVVTEVRPGEGFSWRGRLVMPGLFDGTHHFVIERIDGERSRFTQVEDFSGILVPFVGFTPYKAGWERMNRALKARVETNRDMPK
jgi:hypothetical protein